MVKDYHLYIMLMTIGDFIKVYGIPQNTVYRWIREGKTDKLKQYDAKPKQIAGKTFIEIKK